MKRRKYAVAAAFALLVLLVAVTALARPGGGSSYSGGGGGGFGGGGSSGGGSSGGGSSGGGSWGGGSSSSGGGGGDDIGGAIIGALFELLVRVLFELALRYPAVSVPLVVGAVIAYLLTRRDPGGYANAGFIAGAIALLPLGYFAPWAFIGTLTIAGAVALHRWHEKDAEGWTASVEDETPEAAPTPKAAPTPSAVPDAPAAAPTTTAVRSVRGTLQALREVDPDFSIVVIEDFLYALYAEVQRARGSDALDALVAYVSEEERAKLGGAGLASVEDVIIGGMRWLGVEGTGAGDARTTVRVEFAVNYTEVARDGSRQGVESVERWTLSRAAGVRSTPFKVSSHFSALRAPVP